MLIRKGSAEISSPRAYLKGQKMTAVTNPHLFLLPGLLNDARLWQHQISGLSDMADASVADLTRADSISSLASAALAQAPTERFALAGLSMGGCVALEIMRHAPERVLGLALLNTTARPDTPQATEDRRNLMQLAETNFPAVIDTLLPRLVHPSRLHDDSIIDVITAMANSVGKEAFIRQQRAMIGRIDSRPFLHQIKCPTLVLCGREDVITTIEVHQEMVTGIPGSSLAIIEECGHLSTLGQPQRVTEALRKWLLEVNDKQRTSAFWL
jgi:pimeloyl-ACP methyl ester carboxylesterase